MGLGGTRWDGVPETSKNRNFEKSKQREAAGCQRAGAERARPQEGGSCGFPPYWSLTINLDQCFAQGVN